MSLRYCARQFTAAEIEGIRQLIADHPHHNRAQLSRLVSEQLHWLRADGRWKEMSCRVAMLRMQADGLIQLPAPLKGNGNRTPYRRRSPATDPELLPVLEPAGALADLHLDLVRGAQASHLWNEYIDRYHYLGYRPLPGAQLRYVARAQQRPLALLGFGAAAWKSHMRDAFIGWTPDRRESRLHLIVNNARFLILPWVRSRNLASRLLAMVAKRLAEDWYERYRYRPVLVETFVEIPRFRGTCYRAANWIYLGDTQGRGKLDGHRTARLPKKSVWVHPLTPHFRRLLCD